MGICPTFRHLSFIPPLGESWYSHSGVRDAGLQALLPSRSWPHRAGRRVDADDDASAIAAVERARGNAQMELWCGTHKVMHWDACPVSSPTVSA